MALAGQALGDISAGFGQLGELFSEMINCIATQLYRCSTRDRYFFRAARHFYFRESDIRGRHCVLVARFTSRSVLLSVLPHSFSRRSPVLMHTRRLASARLRMPFIHPYYSRVHLSDA